MDNHTRTISRSEWLHYLRHHPGSVESAVKLLDMLPKLSRQEQIVTVSEFMIAFGERVTELRSHKS